MTPPFSSFVLILDRDNTINADPGYLNDPEKVVLLPHAAEGIALLNRFGIRVYVASNQSGIARGIITPAQLAAVNQRIVELLSEGGARIEKFFICPHQDSDNCSCRKPRPGLIQQIIAEYQLNPAQVFIAGDRARDLLCAEPFGIRGILIGDEEKTVPTNCVFRAQNLVEMAAFILQTIFDEQSSKKIFMRLEDFLPQLEEVRHSKKRVVFTNGCFDILHSGHVQLLAQARALGDYLVLGLNSDRSVRALKGPSRPINSAIDRARLLAQLPYVDAIVIFDTDTPLELIAAMKPDVHVKGGDYVREKLPEFPLLHSMGKEVVILPFRQGYSTTTILERSDQSKRQSNRGEK